MLTPPEHLILPFNGGLCCSFFIYRFRQCPAKRFIGQRFWFWLLWYKLILPLTNVYWDEAYNVVAFGFTLSGYICSYESKLCLIFGSLSGYRSNILKNHWRRQEIYHHIAPLFVVIVPGSNTQYMYDADLLIIST